MMEPDDTIRDSREKGMVVKGHGRPKFVRGMDWRMIVLALA